MHRLSYCALLYRRLISRVVVHCVRYPAENLPTARFIVGVRHGIYEVSHCFARTTLTTLVEQG